MTTHIAEVAAEAAVVVEEAAVEVVAIPMTRELRIILETKLENVTTLQEYVEKLPDLVKELGVIENLANQPSIREDTNRVADLLRLRDHAIQIGTENIAEVVNLIIKGYPAELVDLIEESKTDRMYLRYLESKLGLKPDWEL
jgi:hypothetical protein